MYDNVICSTIWCLTCLVIGWHNWEDPDVCAVDVFTSGFSICYRAIGTVFLFVATALYILVFRRARQKLAEMTRDIERFHGRHQALQNEITRSRSIGMILGVFIICWLPFVISAPLQLFVSSRDLIIAHKIGVLCGILNSALNPGIYGLRSKEFKQGFKKLKRRINRKCNRFEYRATGPAQP